MVSIFDLRCPETLCRPSVEQGRCQLFAGHESPHAVMFSSGERRIVRTWRGHDPSTAQDGRVELAGLPWLRGLPMPAWSADSSADADVRVDVDVDVDLSGAGSGTPSA